MKRWLLAAGASALVLSACSAAPSDSDRLPEGSAFEEPVSAEQGEVFLRSDHVFLFTADLVATQEKATLISAAPFEMDEGFEILAVRANFVRRVRDRTAVVAGYPGTACTDQWPPEGFGPTFPIEELELDPGDQFAVNFFLRPRHTGTLTFRGLVLTYRQGGNRFKNTREGTILWTVRVRDEEDVEEIPEGQLCRPLRSIWFGETGSGDRVVCRESDGRFGKCENRRE